MTSIILFSRDPGGANCIIAVYDKLRQTPGIKTYLWGKDFATDKYREWKLDYQDISNLTLPKIRSLVQIINPKLILTGTSYGDYSEQNLWQTARELHIPSAAIIDQWLNYRLRFTSTQGKLVTSDKILIMDNFTKREMIKEGFNQDQLLVVGHPYLDQLRSQALSAKPHPRRQHSILFISEPIAQAAHLNLGYTEDTVLSHLTQALSALHQDVRLTVKFHPKHQPPPSQSASLYQLILESDLVIGMQSIGLIEAYILGKPILSVQIGLRQPDEFILSRRGITRTIRSSKMLKAALRRFFVTGRVDYQKKFLLVSHARKNIVNFILDTVVKYKPYAATGH